MILSNISCYVFSYLFIKITHSLFKEVLKENVL